MARTKQTAKKTSGGIAIRRKVPSLPQPLGTETSREKSVKKIKNIIHLPSRRKSADPEASVVAGAHEIIAINSGREGLVSLHLAAFMPANIR